MELTKEQKELILRRYRKDNNSQASKDDMLDDWRQGALDLDWFDFVVDDFVEQTSKAGIEIERESISFSVSFSQSDYVCFSADIDLKTLINKKAEGFYENFDPWELNLFINGTECRYDYCIAKSYHGASGEKNYIDFDEPAWYGYGYNDQNETEKHALEKYEMLVERIHKELLVILEEMLSDLNQELYKALEKKQDWLTSEERIWDELYFHFIEGYIEYAVLTIDEDDIKKFAKTHNKELSADKVSAILKKIKKGNFANILNSQILG